MTRSSLLRMWWAAPMALVAGSAIGAAIVVGPTVGDKVGVPRELVVPVAGNAAPASAPPVTRPHPVKTHRPAPAPTHAATAPAATHDTTTRVVQPRRPVVSQSPDDHSESSGDSTGDGGHEGGDG
jgi:hypothetical protein